MLIQSFLCVRHSAQAGIYILSFNLHFNTIIWVLLSPPFVQRLGSFPNFSQLIKYRSWDWNLEMSDLALWTITQQFLHTRSEIPGYCHQNYSFRSLLRLGLNLPRWPALLETCVLMSRSRWKIPKRDKINPILTISGCPPAAAFREKQRNGELWASVE